MNRRLALPLLLLLPLALALVGCADSVGPVSRVVVITLDTTRADRLGAYGYEGGTSPRIDALAAEAVLFEQAVSQVPTTLPSHSTMFTGLYPQDHGVRRNMIFKLGPEVETLAEHLSAAGFTTAGFPATFIVGENFGIAQGFDHYEAPPGGGGVVADAVYRLAADGVDLTLDWLDGHEDGKLFVWLHLYDPHAPYRPPFPYSDRFPNQPYEGEIAYMDAQVGRLLERLQGDGRWDETLVVIAGDHGEGLHDHGERHHSFLLYETTQRVPFVIRAPGVGVRRVAEPVALIDLMPTVLDLVGLEVPEGQRGISLRAALSGDELPRRDLYFETLCGALNYGWAELRGLRYGSWKLIDSATPELYDLANDPDERNNLAAIELERVEEMRAVLAEISEPLADGATAVEAMDPVLDAETEAMLASLGYVASASGGSSGAEAPHPREMIHMASEIIGAQIAIFNKNWPYLEELTGYVLSNDPGNKWAMATRITALLSMGRAGDAQDVGAVYVERYPKNARAYELFARAYAAEGRFEDAHKVLLTGLAALPGNEALTYLSLVAAFDVDDPTVCTEQVPRALAEDPARGRLHVLQARCEARAGDPLRAFSTLVVAVRNGFRELELLRDAPDFADVVSQPRFDELAASIEQARKDGQVER
jgi:arylsulfatase A-like enzyme